MKNLLFTLVSFSVLLLIGCQENSITDPIQDTELQKTDDPAVTSGTIVLEGMLQDPQPVMNSYYIINGEIQYQHRLEILDPISPNPQYIVSLNFSVTANFTYLCTVCTTPSDDALVGTIAVGTNDNLYVSEDGIRMLEKTFEILGRDDGMVLKCRFLVTTDGIGLNAMWLAISDENQNQIELNKNVGPEPVTYPPVYKIQYN